MLDWSVEVTANEKIGGGFFSEQSPSTTADRGF